MFPLWPLALLALPLLAPRSGGAKGGSGPAPAGPGGAPPAGWVDALPLPTAADVPGFDLERNWGKTPVSLRPLFALAERASGIFGAGRILALVARRESAFVPTAHNDSAGEVDASRRAYARLEDVRPPLAYGVEAGEFGSGGLFGLLGPYFLWTGVQELGSRAPLLGSPPEIVFLPRVATFGGLVYLQRIVANYRIDDVPDVKVGWASPSLLGDGRGGETYRKVRQRFAEDVAKLGIDLGDAATIPARPSAAGWPGVGPVFDRVVGTLPRRA